MRVPSHLDLTLMVHTRGLHKGHVPSSDAKSFPKGTWKFPKIREPRVPQGCLFQGNKLPPLSHSIIGTII